MFKVPVLLFESAEFVLDEDLKVAHSLHHLFELFTQLSHLYPQGLVIYSKVLQFSNCPELSKGTCAQDIHLGTHALV
jgi:hypothetical protein